MVETENIVGIILKKAQDGSSENKSSKESPYEFDIKDNE